jgi:hypothetical protein
VLARAQFRISVRCNRRRLNGLDPGPINQPPASKSLIAPGQQQTCRRATTDIFTAAIIFLIGCALRTASSSHERGMQGMQLLRAGPAMTFWPALLQIRLRLAHRRAFILVSSRRLPVVTHTFHVKIQYPYGCEFINSVLPLPTHTAVGRRPTRVNWWKRARRNGMRHTSHKGRPRCPQVSGDELPPQFCAEAHWFKCWVHRILQPQVCVIHRRQGMVRMYSTSLAEANVPNGREGCKLGIALRPNRKFCSEF